MFPGFVPIMIAAMLARLPNCSILLALFLIQLLFVSYLVELADATTVVKFEWNLRRFVSYDYSYRMLYE
jgi:hypothetical protein